MPPYKMTKPSERRRKRLESETGFILKKRTGRIKVSLIYPNTYRVGMSNLGFQTVYHQINGIEDAICERVFLPDDRRESRIRTIESGSNPGDFDIVAFSVSFENDYVNIPLILERIGVPVKSANRSDPRPLVIAGGVACMLNPEPISDFFDCFLIGEAEALLPRFFSVFRDRCFESEPDRSAWLEGLARNVPGVYVPEFYHVESTGDGNIRSFEPLREVPEKIDRLYLRDLSETATYSSILTPETAFGGAFLIETGRGCPHGCRFCSAGFVYRPPRFRPVSFLDECVEKESRGAEKIGLVGAAVSDLPGLDGLCGRILERHAGIGFSSLRADAITPNLAAILKKCGAKTATIAPEAGSEKMRRIINKSITEEHILSAAENIVSAGVMNIRLYFMIGLPSETAGDIEAIVELCGRIKRVFLESSRSKGRIGEITVSLNAFVPKPVTPFQWMGMEKIAVLKKKIKFIKNALRKTANVEFQAESPRNSYVQALLSKGDRDVSEILHDAFLNSGNWAKTIKRHAPRTDRYVYGERSTDQMLPWDFIDSGVEKTFLENEMKKALKAEKSPDCKMTACRICGVCE